MKTLLSKILGCFSRPSHAVQAEPGKKPRVTYGDPDNLALHPGVTSWEDCECCPRCLRNVTIREHCAKVCEGCGFRGDWMLDFPNRSYRQVTTPDGPRWQYLYPGVYKPELTTRAPNESIPVNVKTKDA